jgi:hypothetical protein
MLAAAAGVIAISGGTIVSIPNVLRQDGLTARTIAHLLSDAVPPDVHDVRVNGVYGSAHKGTWQFVASLTWRTADGTIGGGTTELPQHGGQPPIPSQLDLERLEHEHRIGWSVAQLRHAMRRIDIGNESLAMVELAITADEQPRVLTCSAAGTEAAATCTEYDADGDVRRRFADWLVDVYGLEAVSVQRVSAPVTATP